MTPADPDATPLPPPEPGRVEFFRHDLGEAEVAALTGVIGSLFLTTGPQVRALEAELAGYLGVAEAVGVSSCTAALHLSLAALDVGPGDEVIVPPTTFVSTANVVVYLGATPVFADVEPDTGLLDPVAVAAAITPRTRAVVPVHLYGQMADMAALADLAARHGLALVEDGAHGIEARREGLAPAHLGDTACFSFYATKTLTSGEGGLIATRDPDLAARLRRLRLHGIDRDAATRHGLAYRHWDMVELGFKANLSDLQAAILRAQVPGIEARRAARQALHERYDARLADVPGLRLPTLRPGVTSAHHLYTVRVDAARRDAILDGLQARGIGVAVNFRPVHLLTYYRERFGFASGLCPHAEALGAQTISLPLYPSLTHAQQARVVTALAEVLDRG